RGGLSSRSRANGDRRGPGSGTKRPGRGISWRIRTSGVDVIGPDLLNFALSTVAVEVGSRTRSPGVSTPQGRYSTTLEDCRYVMRRAPSGRSSARFRLGDQLASCRPVRSL